MADPARRRPENVDGDFFVDDTCIDCGTCMWMAPDTFQARGPMSAVTVQPADAGTRRRALQALVSCPTSSIGGGDVQEIRRARDSFPDPIAEGLWHLGFHARSSFGAAAYLVATAAGNIMIDSPRFSEPLARKLDEMGGVQGMLFTHRDDVADHERFAQHFGCRRFIHAADADAIHAAEVVFDFQEATEILPGITAIPVPGHTRGSTCYQVSGTLFTGDHMAWDAKAGRLKAFRDACWYSWAAQTDAMERLRGRQFTRVLPGHGRPATLPAARMQEALEACIQWMRS